MSRLAPNPCLAVLGLAAGLIGLTLGAAAPDAGAASSKSLSRIVSAGELRVGLSGNQPPLNVLNRAGEIIGLEADLARLLAGSMGVQAKFVRKPFGELLGALEKGEVDLVMSGMTITPERNLKVAFVGPYFISGKSILTRSETLAASDEPADIDSPDITLAALDGSTSQRWVEVFVPRAKLVKVVEYDGGVQLVREGKVDAFVADYPICVLSVLRYGGEGLVTLAAPLTMEPIGIALPGDDFLFVNLVDNYLNALTATGALERLQKAWFENGAWLADLP
jgi:ABC-type amino acid transport substrate-binding protein